MKKYYIKIAILIIAAIFAGKIVDDKANIGYNLFIIVLPLIAGLFAFYIIKDLTQKEIDENNESE